MVTRPFSSVIGMSPIGGFKNRFVVVVVVVVFSISWANVGAKIFVAGY